MNPPPHFRICCKHTRPKFHLALLQTRIVFPALFFFFLRNRCCFIRAEVLEIWNDDKFALQQNFSCLFPSEQWNSIMGRAGFFFLLLRLIRNNLIMFPTFPEIWRRWVRWAQPTWLASCSISPPSRERHLRHSIQVVQRHKPWKNHEL